MTCKEKVEYYRTLHNRLKAAGGVDWFIDHSKDTRKRLDVETVLSNLDKSPESVEDYRYHFTPRGSSTAEIDSEFLDGKKERKNNQVLVDKNTLENLVACKNTLYSVQRVLSICPKCRSYMLVEGYVCLGCGYDPTAPEEYE